jgi:hypothetical protein
MKLFKYCILILLPVFYLNSSAQDNFKYKIHGISLKKNDFPDNFPFRFGVEAGPVIPIKEKKYFYNGIWVFSNLNLYNKRLFLRLAYGLLNTNEELGNNADYFSAGISGIPFQYKQHSISLQGGLCLYRYIDKSAVIALSAGVNYLYRINKYISLSAGIQFPVIRSTQNNDFHHNPFAVFGIQIF